MNSFKEKEGNEDEEEEEWCSKVEFTWQQGGRFVIDNFGVKLFSV